MLHPGKAKFLTKQVKERKRMFSYNKDESTEPMCEREISGFVFCLNSFIFIQFTIFTQWDAEQTDQEQAIYSGV